MARGSGFGALGKNFIIVGDARHRIFRLRFGYLIRATTSFFCALTPVPGVVKEGPRFHGLAPLQDGVLQPQNNSPRRGGSRRRMWRHALASAPECRSSATSNAMVQRRSSGESKASCAPLIF